jgi:hypothetical protein
VDCIFNSSGLIITREICTLLIRNTKNVAYETHFVKFLETNKLTQSALSIICELMLSVELTAENVNFGAPREGHSLIIVVIINVFDPLYTVKYNIHRRPFRFSVV